MAWVERRSPSERSLLAVRSVVRILGYLSFSDSDVFERKALAAFRAALIAVERPQASEENSGVADAKAAVEILAGDEIEQLEDYPILASRYALEARSLPSSANSAGSVSIAAVSARSTNAYSYFGLNASKAFDWDCANIQSDLRTRPVWIKEEPPSEIVEAHNRFLEMLEADTDWAFFHGWYSRTWAGSWNDWDLAHEVARIDAETWDKGLTAVATKIREIEARNTLKKHLEALPQAGQIEIRNRHGIGGNAPPEVLEDVSELSAQAVFIWSGVEALKNEVAEDKPDAQRVKTAISLLSKGLAACLKWLGRKGDLALDTLIKWGIPAGAAYYLTNPAKIEALISAAEKWLPFL